MRLGFDTTGLMLPICFVESTGNTTIGVLNRQLQIYRIAAQLPQIQVT
jgi:hypothetical protein